MRVRKEQLAATPLTVPEANDVRQRLLLRCEDDFSGLADIGTSCHGALELGLRLILVGLPITAATAVELS